MLVILLIVPFFMNMAPKVQYKWRAKDPDRPSEESQWYEQKADVFRDFMEFFHTEELFRRPMTRDAVGMLKPNPNAPRQDPVYYLDKRVFLDNPGHFYIFGLQKKTYRLFRWKVKCQWNVFSLAKDPAWTFHKGAWTDDFYDCMKEYSRECAGGFENLVAGCTTQAYLYMRSYFLLCPFRDLVF